MAKELFGVEGLTISHSLGSKTSGGTFTVTSVPSLKAKAEGQGIYKGTLTFSFSAGNSSETLSGVGIVTPGTVYGTGSIEPTATKNKVESSFVIRDKDAGSFITLFGTFVPTSTGTPAPNTPLPVTDVEISDANQTKVLGE